MPLVTLVTLRLIPDIPNNSKIHDNSNVPNSPNNPCISNVPHNPTTNIANTPNIPKCCQEVETLKLAHT
jgi:hypothetical protein